MSPFPVPKAKAVAKDEEESESGAFRIIGQSLAELRAQVAKRKHEGVSKKVKPHAGNAQILAHLETRMAAAEERQARMDRELQAQSKREALALVPRKRSERIQVLELSKEQEEIDAAQAAAAAKAKRAEERAELTLLYLQVYDDFHGVYGAMDWDMAHYAPHLNASVSRRAPSPPLPASSSSAAAAAAAAAATGYAAALQ